MKIKTARMSYEEVCALPRQKRRKPMRQGMFFRRLLKAISASDLKQTNFKRNDIGMDKLAPDEPCLVLMNHSSFIDIKIASTVLFPRPFNTICTSDGFIGKSGLMYRLGCIPARKFITDLPLFHDMVYTAKKLKCSILLFPEASYTFDGTATPLPESLGKLIKTLGVPVVLIRTYGAFARDPLYNNLQLRNVDVSADVEYLLSPEQASQMSAKQINELVAERFSFDNFRWQRDNGVVISEPFRADGLNRVLYKCPHCLREGCMVGKGTTISCSECGKTYELTELGALRAIEGETEFDHIPGWFAWERKQVREELINGSYSLDLPVDIRMLVDDKCIYAVGEGRLRHSVDGFKLTGCDGKLDVTVKPLSSYSVYADYFWYEIGDMVCIGDDRALYYCFPQNGEDIAAKTRLAAEELYKLTKNQQ